MAEAQSVTPAGIPISAEEVELTIPVVEEPEITNIMKRAPLHRPLYFKPKVCEDSGSEVESVTGNTPEVPSS